MNHSPDVVIVGHLGVNITETRRAGRTETLGGAAYHAAIGALTVKDCRVGVVARVGVDELGQKILDQLDNFGIDVEGVIQIRGQSTAVFQQRETSDGVRAGIKINLGAAQRIDTKAFPKTWEATHCVHLATAPPDQYLGWIRALHRVKKHHPKHISIDAFERYALSSPALMLQAMRQCDLVFLNYVEMVILRDKVDNSRTKLGFPKVPYVLKSGPLGSKYVDEVHHVEIAVEAPRVGVVETTGAGDILAGAYVAGFAIGLDKQTSLSHAVEVASESVTRAGVEHILKPYSVLYVQSLSQKGK